MADKKISALGASTTPLAGTEVLPIVQSSTTVNVSVANLTAGRAVSASSLSLTTTPLGVASGGTGVATLTSGYLLKGNGTSAVSASVIYDTGTNAAIGNTTPRGLLHLGTSASATDIPVPAGNFAIVRAGTYGLAGTGGIQLSGGYGDAGRVAAWQVKAVGSGSAGSFINDLLFTTQNSFSGSETTRASISAAGDITASTGNLIIGTAGKGIDFSANGGDILKQYDEGTYTPVITASSGLIISYTSSGRFTRIGRMVTAVITFKITNVGTASGAIIATLPSTGDAAITYVGAGRDDNTGNMVQGRVQTAVPGSVYFATYANASIAATNTEVFFSIQYFV